MRNYPVRSYSSLQTDAERESALTEQLPQVRYIARRIHERLPRHVPSCGREDGGMVKSRNARPPTAVAFRTTKPLPYRRMDF